MLFSRLPQALDTNLENMRMETWQNACRRHVGLNTFGNEHVDVNLMSLFGAAVFAHQPWILWPSPRRPILEPPMLVDYRPTLCHAMEGDWHIFGKKNGKQLAILLVKVEKGFAKEVCNHILHLPIYSVPAHLSHYKSSTCMLHLIQNHTSCGRTTHRCQSVCITVLSSKIFHGASIIHHDHSLASGYCSTGALCL